MRRWLVLCWLLASVSLSAQPTTSVYAEWDLDPTHDGATFEIEVDGVSRPCAPVVVQATERRCGPVSVSTGSPHTFRLRALSSEGVSAWSEPVSQGGLSPGAFTITFIRPPPDTDPEPEPSMAISRIGTTKNSAGSGTAVTVPVPLGIQAGDLAVVAVSVNNNPTITDNGGANALTAARPSETYAGNGARVSSFIRILDGTETGNFALTLSGSQRWSAAARVYRGVDQANPIDLAIAALSTGSNTAPTGASVTTVTDGAVIVSFATVDDGGAITFGEPSGWSGPDGTTSNQAIFGADQVFATAGASGSIVWALSASRVWAVTNIPLRPAAGGGGGGNRRRRVLMAQ